MAKKKLAGAKGKAGSRRGYAKKDVVRFQCGKSLWLWLGNAKQCGEWIAVYPEEVESDCKRWKPPRAGKRIFELVWTPNVPAGFADRNCEGGYCEYDENGLCDDQCYQLGPECWCAPGISFGPDRDFLPVHTITACLVTTDPQASAKAVGKKTRARGGCGCP